MLKMNTCSYHHFYKHHLKMSAIIMEEFLIQNPLIQHKVICQRASVHMVCLNHALNKG